MMCQDDFAYAQHCTSIGRRLAMQKDFGYGDGCFMETRQEFLRGAYYAPPDDSSDDE